MKAYKGFNKDMTCLGFQFKEGETYETDEAKLCEKGFHACEAPLDTFGYYVPSKSEYHEVELEDVSDDRSSNDTKVVSKRIKIGAKLSISQIVDAQFEFVREHCTNENNDELGKAASAGECGAASAGYRGAASAGEYGAASAGECGAASAGYRGAASAGEYGAASAGEYGAASAGYRGVASAGECGAASAGECGAASAGEYGAAVSRGTASVEKCGIACARGNGCRVRGGLNSVLVIAEESQSNCEIASWKAVVVDGEIVKADTWYTLRNGELLEVPDEG